jgi:GT2 family glycosyltransferase
MRLRLSKPSQGKRIEKESSSPMIDIQVSVLIPTCNRPESLKICLDAMVICVSKVPSTGIEILVGNDGDTENVPIVPHFPPNATVSIMAGPRRGPASNRNALALKARGPLLVFLDDDVIPKPELLDQYISVWQSEPETPIFEGKIICNQTIRFAYEGAPFNTTGGYLWSANMAVQRRSFWELNGFDEDYPYAAMEDVDFRVRAMKNDFDIRWCPGAVVVHPLTIHTGRARNIKSEYAALLFVLKHPEQIEKVRSNCSLRAIARLIRGGILRRNIIQPIASYKSLLQDVLSLLRTRHRLRDEDKIGDELKKIKLALSIKN